MTTEVTDDMAPRVRTDQNDDSRYPREGKGSGQGEIRSAASKAAQKAAETRKLSVVMGRSDFPTEAKCLIGDLVYDLAETPTGAHLISTAEQARVRILLNDGHDNWGGYDREHNRIVLRAPVRPDGSLRTRVKAEDRGQMLLTLAHELRHVWQEQQGRLIDELGFSPADALVVNRFVEADAEAVTVQVAWERREMGDHDCWNADHGWYRDVYAAYRRVAELYPAAVKSGMAIQAAFKQWFRHHNRVLQNDNHRLAWWGIDAGHSPGRANRAKRPLRIEELLVLGDAWREMNYLTGRQARPLDLMSPRYCGGITKKNRQRIAQLNARYGHEQSMLPFAESKEPAKDRDDGPDLPRFF